MKKTIIFSILFAAASILFLDSCNKKKKEVDNETQSVVDNAICEQQFIAIQPVVNQKGINQAGIKKISSCEAWIILGAIGTPSVTSPGPQDTADVNSDGLYDNGPVTFQIDYGTTGCTGSDGIVRRGKINITTPKRWSVLNNTVTVDLVTYKYGNVTYSGSITISRPDSLTLTSTITNGHCTDGSWNVDYSGTKTIVKTAGLDEYTITGNSSGKNREGRNFTTNIISPLVKKGSCKFITSGVLELTPDGFKTRTVDFGNGTCDDQATFTVNGQTVTFTMK